MEWQQKMGGGFVYAEVRIFLERQELILDPYRFENNYSEVPYKYRYFRYTEPKNRVEELQKPTILLKDHSLNNFRSEKKLIRLDPVNGTNKFTGGIVNHPANKYREKPNENPGSEYNKSSKHFDESHANLTMVNVKYKIPSPVLTPFDFIIFKCKDLIVDIMRFVSKYDEAIVLEIPFKSNDFFDIYWYDGYPFPDPLRSDYVHYCLKNLNHIIKLLSLHTTNHDDKYFKGKQRRVSLINEIRRPRLLHRVASYLYGIVDGLDQDLVKLNDPELKEINNEYLYKSVMEIQIDLERVYKDITSPNKFRSYQYEYRGTFENG